MNAKIEKIKCERVKRKAVFEWSTPPREWKIQELNKLKLYRNFIIKKAEITPIR